MLLLCFLVLSCWQMLEHCRCNSAGDFSQKAMPKVCPKPQTALNLNRQQTTLNKHSLCFLHTKQLLNPGKICQRKHPYMSLQLLKHISMLWLLIHFLSHTQTDRHTHTHTNRERHTRTHTHTPTHPRKDGRTDGRTGTHTHTHAHRDIPTYLTPCLPACLPAYRQID